MNIDKSFLKEYILGSKENSYLLELYKIYGLSDIACKGNIRKNRDLLDYFEDKIYTIKGRKLSQKERIIFDLNKIMETISKSDNKDLGRVIEEELLELISLMDKSTLDNAKQNTYDLIKEKIVVIEARLHLPINFFYSAAMSFLNIYESAYINNKFFIYNENLYNNNKEMDKLNHYYNKDIIKNIDINDNIKKGDK